MCDKAQATKSADSCHSTHSRRGNWGYDVWREWGRQCDVNYNHRKYPGQCPIWQSVSRKCQ